MQIDPRYGEVVPLGPNYLPSYAAGVRSGIKELGPKLIGQDPTQIRVINTFMDYHLKGHPYVKSPIDMACWDILGKVLYTSHNIITAPVQWVKSNAKSRKKGFWLERSDAINLLYSGQLSCASNCCYVRKNI
jgi:hypothetical protein